MDRRSFLEAVAVTPIAQTDAFFRDLPEMKRRRKLYIGYRALKQTDSVPRNLGIGYHALKVDTTGSS